ncbi:coth protein-domain-containing protein [Mucor mucedo]|uniref:coth protein-domain-containing protein n=1 Tax=Mucor mucedo TaxID=29922 RepID=UPI00221F676E|nr:coth protein-domain-containing protein [Mucor mucedo]KAI7892714.1 coth protein-domain-containing protein [Mucor mucedo]
MYCDQFVVFTAAIHATDITYKVISLVPNGETVAVIVNNHIYPLTNANSNSSLLHFGEAPAPNNGDYKYVIIENENNQIVESENFTRTISDGTTSTPNDYYGRSWNYFDLPEMPDILPSLPIIHRIQSKLHIHNEIPTIHFYGDQSLVDMIHQNQTADIDIHLNMTYISPDDVVHFPNVTVALSGHSTRGLSKVSYSFKTPTDDYLYGYRRIKLRSMSMDSSYMRDYMSYGVAKAIGQPSSEYSYARLYINDRAIGLFGVAEAFKAPWIRNEFANGDANFDHGALYTADIFGGKELFGALENGDGRPKGSPDGEMQPLDSPAELSYLGSNVSLYSAGQYDVKEDPSSGSPNYTRIMDVSKFISEQPTIPLDNDSTVSLWEKEIDVVSFLRGLALEIILSDTDGYLTMGNNYILYNDLVHQRLVFSGQDFDLTMGTMFYNASKMLSGNYSDYPGFYKRPVPPALMAVPHFKQEFENLLINITTELVNNKVLGNVIRGVYNMIEQDVAWDQSLPRVASDILPGAIGNINSSLSNDAEQMFQGVSFQTAVFGPSVSNYTMSLLDWLSIRSNNILTFFNQPLIE